MDPIRITETDDWIVRVYADGSSDMTQKRNKKTEETASLIFHERMKYNTKKTALKHEKERLEKENNKLK